MPSSSSSPLPPAPVHYGSQLLAHLDLVAGMVDELGLVELAKMAGAEKRLKINQECVNFGHEQLPVGCKDYTA